MIGDEVKSATTQLIFKLFTHQITVSSISPLCHISALSLCVFFYPFPSSFSCSNTASSPVLLVSVFSVNFLFKFGNFKVLAYRNALLNLKKPFSNSPVHSNLISFLTHCTNISEYPQIPEKIL